MDEKATSRLPCGFQENEVLKLARGVLQHEIALRQAYSMSGSSEKCFYLEAVGHCCSVVAIQGPAAESSKRLCLCGPETSSLHAVPVYGP